MLLAFVPRWGSCLGVLLIWFGGTKGAVDAGVVPFTFITAVAVPALTKGPVTDAITSWSAEVEWQAAWVREWRRCSWWLGLWHQTSMEIVQVEVFARSVCQTWCRCILPKGSVIMKPGLARELAVGLHNQKLVLRHALPSRRVWAAGYPHVDRECLHPCHNVSDLLYLFLWWTHQKSTVKISLQLHFWGL